MFDSGLDNEMASEMMRGDHGAGAGGSHHGGHGDHGDHFNAMMTNIHEIYKRISDKLNFWQSIVKRKNNGGGGDDR